MRSLIARWEMKLRDRVRAWLLGEEIQSIGCIKYQVKNLGSALAQSITHDASILSALARIEAQQGIHQASTSALRDSEERHFRDLLEGGTRIEAAQNRLHDLVEPELKVRRRVVPAVPSWEQVQAEQLREFEENKR